MRRAPSSRELAYAVAAAVLRQESNGRAMIGLFAEGADADAVADELRELARVLLLPSVEPGQAFLPAVPPGFTAALSAAADQLGAEELQALPAPSLREARARV